ncbi:MAG TPA: hypothetical protein VMB79_15340 [Jatrophihabitans sp.]|nr:hypothetical protein [Jatrophihabitans sp.]
MREISAALTRGRLAGAAVGAALGTVVGVLVHLLSWTLPSTYYVGTYQSDGSDTASSSTWPAGVHPSWWPSLPVLVLAGAVLGYLAVTLLTRSGWRLTRER